MRYALASLAMLLAGASSADAIEVRECSHAETNQSRVLCLEAELPATPSEVWALWSESAQLRTWMAPVARIDMRPGGVLEAAYDPAAQYGDPTNVLNRVVAFEPQRMLSIQIARAPDGFPHADIARNLTTVIEFHPVGANTTRVRVSMSGYGDTPAYDELYAFFARGNAWTLQKLHERIVDGPVDWSATQ